MREAKSVIAHSLARVVRHVPDERRDAASGGAKKDTSRFDELAP
jgi:hypothetical protein